MIAAGAALETSDPKPAFRKMSRLTIPMLIVTGMNRISTCFTRGSRQSQTNDTLNSIRRSAANTIRNCTTVATSHAIAYA